jgi:hypothetical protein
LAISRLSIYAGQQGGLTEFTNNAPLALAAAWQAPDGRVAIVLASMSDRPAPVVLTIPTAEYGILPGSRMTRLSNSGRDGIGTASKPVTTLKETLPARAAWIIEFARP